MVTVASWVGYDLDGRRDIQWSDTIRLKLGEKVAKLADYCAQRRGHCSSAKNPPKGLVDFIVQAQKALSIAQTEQAAFEQDLAVDENLAAAAKLLTTAQSGRWLDMAPAFKASMQPSNKHRRTRSSTSFWSCVRI